MPLLFRTLIVVACLGLLPRPSLGAEGAAGIQGSSGPAAAGAPQAAPAPTPNCDQPTSPHAPGNGPVSVTVNAATAWQPRNGEVLVAVNGDPAGLAGLTVLGCFAWTNAQVKDYFTAASLGQANWQQGFVTIRPSNQTGLWNIGIIVPPLPWAKSNFWDRWFSLERSSGLGLVPVVDMRLIGYTASGVIFDEVRPIGITHVLFASVVALLSLGLALTILYRLADVRPAPPVGTAPPPRNAVARSVRSAVSGLWILTLIQTPDGRASLSAFQVLLWTLIVVSSAAFVMTLSGNLINITTGTLTLLGIAGAAGVLAAFTDAPAAPGVLPPPPSPAVPTSPAWRHLIMTIDGTTPDITRIQMLFFTVIGSGFVILQVVNYFVIPDIPAGYQLLLGISNGIYVSNKLAPKR